MTEDEIQEGTAEDNGKKKTGKGGKTGTDSMGTSGVVVSDGFYAYMSSIGASVSQIASVLTSWRHLRGTSLVQALKDFAGRRSRASAHAQVEIKKGSDYGLLHNFFAFLKNANSSPDHKASQENQNKKQPGQNGPTPN